MKTTSIPIFCYIAEPSTTSTKGNVSSYQKSGNTYRHIFFLNFVIPDTKIREKTKKYLRYVLQSFYVTKVSTELYLLNHHKENLFEVSRLLLTPKFNYDPTPTAVSFFYYNNTDWHISVNHFKKLLN